MVKCEICGKEFLNTGGLGGHLAIVHGKARRQDVLRRTLFRLESKLDYLGAKRASPMKATLNRIEATLAGQADEIKRLKAELGERFEANQDRKPDKLGYFEAMVAVLIDRYDKLHPEEAGLTDSEKCAVLLRLMEVGFRHEAEVLSGHPANSAGKEG